MPWLIDLNTWSSNSLVMGERSVKWLLQYSWALFQDFRVEIKTCFADKLQTLVIMSTLKIVISIRAECFSVRNDIWVLFSSFCDSAYWVNVFVYSFRSNSGTGWQQNEHLHAYKQDLRWLTNSNNTSTKQISTWTFKGFYFLVPPFLPWKIK